MLQCLSNAVMLREGMSCLQLTAWTGLRLSSLSDGAEMLEVHACAS